MEDFFKDARTIARLRDNPLAAQIVAFADWLRERGYSQVSSTTRIRLAASFANWVKDNGIPFESISRTHVGQYLAARKQRPTHDDIPGLQRFLEVLQRLGVTQNAQTPAPGTSSAQLLVDHFSRYLRIERALSAEATYNYTKFAKRFLADRFPHGNPNLPIICAADVVSFVQRQAANLKKEQAKLMTCALRAFLRYAHFEGLIANDLASAVPTVPNWQMVSIPRTLSAEQVNRVLNSCDRQTAVGRRDYAILLLLARLGLRGGAIVSLRLQDIDWRAGTITVRGKGNEIHLPLPQDVGEAVATYLQNGRPRTASRAVFIRKKAPLCGFTKANAISYIVDRALTRAGVEAPSKGAHQFRHTLASEMLRAGASLVQIGQVLGHRSARSTTIYAKVDVVSLRKLAMPWPGGAQ